MVFLYIQRYYMQVHTSSSFKYVIKRHNETNVNLMHILYMIVKRSDFKQRFAA